MDTYRSRLVACGVGIVVAIFTVSNCIRRMLRLSSNRCEALFKTQSHMAVFLRQISKGNLCDEVIFYSLSQVIIGGKRNRVPIPLLLQPT